MASAEWAELPPGLNEPARRLVRRLRVAKDDQGLSLAQLAAHTHYSRASWERWLNGKRLVTPSALTGFARVTGLDVAALAGLLERASLEGGTPLEGAASEGASDEPGTSSAARASIAQLPAAIPDFTGREAELESIVTALTRQERAGAGQTPLVVIRGGGGVGKTTLAVQAANRLAERYPDGALYVDLRGVAENPCDPADVLGGWLRELGEGVEAIPKALEDRAGRFRGLVRDRALLVLLDNARDAAQIRALLPAMDRGAVLVTSRAQLAHLPATLHVLLEPMTYSESLSLLENVAGANRIGREPKAAAVILDACAGLPLALRICAARLETRPSWSVQTLAERVAGEQRRLDELAVGDLAARSSFDMSYAQLTEEAGPGGISPARAFRLLGLAALPEIGLPAAAALFGTDPDRAEYALETLVDVHLLESPSPERYRFHDLIALYAAERGAQEPEAAQQDAIRRLASWYIYAIEHATSFLDVSQQTPTAQEFVLRTPELGLRADTALPWLDREAANILAVTRLIERFGLPELGQRLPNPTFPYFDMRGLWDAFQEINEIALRCALATGDRYWEATARNGVGFAHKWKGRLDEAEASISTALELFEQMKRPIGEAVTLELLSELAGARGDFELRLDYQQRSVAKFREAAEPRRLISGLGNLAMSYALLGRVEEFFEIYEELVPQARALSLGYAVAPMLEAAGEMYLLRGQVPEAVEVLRESCGIFTEIGILPGLADALEHLGDAYAAAGEEGEAMEAWTEAISLFEHLHPAHAEELRTRLFGSGSAAALPG
jgi:tetratricopeptide (TPR) repeat protein/transcriptional regulator with XRE-family HTH domain